MSPSRKMRSRTATRAASASKHANQPSLTSTKPVKGTKCGRSPSDAGPGPMSVEEQNQLNRLMAKKKRYEEQEEAARKANVHGKAAAMVAKEVAEKAADKDGQQRGRKKGRKQVESSDDKASGGRDSL
ncbi:hypothetical protein FOMPIDRAFT_1053065 [Fomitopsis schrenkii]|uniref:Uncharacterized protein n=1 Tax=Fomitopsis schrenkii TaxID=2126942 RepID=S8DVS0_FOMSC|nr:hypothetical protein FOMPIDRAFT_1053065 [Fomitopsis schrenkii]